MPLFHLSAAPAVLAPMLVGGTTGAGAGLSPRDGCGTRCAHATPSDSRRAGAMVSTLAACSRPIRAMQQLPLRFISAAPIDAAVYRDIEKRYACRIVTMYGMTEAFPIAVKGVAERRRARNVGHGLTPVSTCGSSTPTASRSRTDRWGRSFVGPAIRTS